MQYVLFILPITDDRKINQTMKIYISFSIINRGIYLIGWQQSVVQYWATH